MILFLGLIRLNTTNDALGGWAQLGEPTLCILGTIVSEKEPDWCTDKAELFGN